MNFDIDNLPQNSTLWQVVNNGNSFDGRSLIIVAYNENTVYNIAKAMLPSLDFRIEEGGIDFDFYDNLIDFPDDYIFVDSPDFKFKRK